eukprot:1534-Heterococcus_DN1.PRE.5
MQAWLAMRELCICALRGASKVLWTQECKLAAPPATMSRKQLFVVAQLQILSRATTIGATGAPIVERLLWASETYAIF